MVLRNNRSEIEKKFYTLCEKVVEELGLAIYDIDYNASRFLLRIFIFRPPTMTADLSDCVCVDQALTPLFEAESWIPEGICLEVSSPGVFRFLRQIVHFEWAKGEWVHLKLLPVTLDREIISAVDRQKGRVRLISSDEEGIEVEVGNKIVRLTYSQIKKADLDPDLSGVDSI